MTSDSAWEYSERFYEFSKRNGSPCWLTMPDDEVGCVNQESWLDCADHE